MGDAGTAHSFDHDVIIIGAGLSGIYALHRVRQLGLSVCALEKGSDVGGTWYWNRYPGARFDSESVSYGFSWSQEVLDEWSWSEHFAPAPETRAYCQFVANKFDLKKDMQFNITITTAHYQKATQSWLLTADDGRTLTCRWLITAMGVLNDPTLPNIPGLDSFEGESFHTARWPDHCSLKDKRVGIIGVGATGIQTITEIAKQVGSLTVFQRTPNWTAPLRNSKIDATEMESIRQRYPQIFQQCWDSPLNFVHTVDPRSIWDVSEEDRLAHWELQYSLPGFGKWVNNFRDIGRDRAANKLYSDFMANKIRQRVDDPDMAEKLIPKCHGFGTRRVPLESGFYEALNQPNVQLVDVRDGADPIERVTEKGIKTRSTEHEFDVLVYATGFDALTGAFTAIDFQGVNGEKLTDTWEEGPRTFLGFFVRGFPNMGMVMGPHQMYGNIPRSIEYAVDYLARWLGYCRQNGITYSEATEQSVREWTTHVFECSEGLLSNEIDSWVSHAVPP